MRFKESRSLIAALSKRGHELCELRKLGTVYQKPSNDEARKKARLKIITYLFYSVISLLKKLSNCYSLTVILDK